ncbi:uncharacterized protein F5Z01DRAFT_683115 [Emericellopsis atlantica]|uniref:FAD-binding PCMH-type domain-containing protein n=1 Tax=Emericellopsis atlantica TaxID=2614577 RepID=A0A9P7ZH18_9HYPO|nr:uncharacterized protein F5Z01DRAFT_683115 [Emericellopsis atlantica]KAG9251786.1 hypothetical protein F5Z01DRAFT_683115 [Emericellopsis atlantica]
MGCALVTGKKHPAPKPRSDACRCLPSDNCWPSDNTWDGLNNTVNGQLIKTVPIGSPCHDPTYDAEACDALQQRWTEGSLHLPTDSSPMQMYFANQSCDAFTPRDQPCVLGNYVAYSVKVSEPKDAVAAVKFANKNNLRLVIRNTGHDFFGRSTGAGALSIWTHHLKSTDIIPNYSSKSYSGPAMRVGAGVTGAEAAEAAHKAGLTVVVGGCPSVGVAGGYTQGGGHSTLSTAYGLAADQALEYEVVTADGAILTASPKENKDLFWALSGGGGGNYAVVTSVVVRAHESGNVGGGSMQILASDVTPATYAAIIAKFHELAPKMADSGATIMYILNGLYFSLTPVTVVDSTGDYVRNEVLGEFIDFLEENNVKYAAGFSTLAFRDHYDRYLGPLPWGSLSSSDYQYGGRLIPRSVVEDEPAKLSGAVISLLPEGVIAVGTLGNFTPPHAVSNAVHPKWRSTLIQLQLLTQWSTKPEDWDAMLANQARMTNDYVPRIKAVTPDGAAYMNEADFHEPDWKNAFYGEGYEQLVKTKKEWDPKGLFWTLKGVASDQWTVAEDGKMCRAA